MLMNFDDICRFLKLYYILAEKQQTRAKHSSSFHFFASLDTQQRDPQGWNNGGVGKIVSKNPNM